MAAYSRDKARNRRKKRVRKHVKGTPERPQLCVFRSARHMYASLIDDTTGKTLTGACTLSQDLAEKIERNHGNKQGALLVGRLIAERAASKGIKKVVFDRNGFLYHGRVKALSEAAREGGLEF